MAIDCFRYLDFKSFDEVDRLTIPQYEIMMKAHALKDVDLDYRVHELAYLTFTASATKQVGKKMKPVYTTFRKFYDYKREQKRALERFENETDEEKFGSLSGYAEYLRKQREEKANG